MKKKHFIIENIKFLCDHSGLHPMKARKGKYNPVNVYNQMRKISILRTGVANRVRKYVSGCAGFS